MEDLKKFARYFKPYKWHVAFGILFILISMAFGLLIPYLVGQAIDDIGREATREKIIYYPLSILVISLLSGIFLFWQRRLLINTSRHIEYDMRRDYYAALVNQPLDFFQNHRVGDLMARATNDLAAVRQIVGPMILYSFQAIFALLVFGPRRHGRPRSRAAVALGILLLLVLALAFGFGSIWNWLVDDFSRR